ncbi:MAG: type II toxin-antitoxin system PemK/MazF family toxin [Planctomycetes bacterium]|nr:type II toxin-antitoxin system PemK/MazF family toxin [Planctomycetota bacterium]
MLVDVPYLDATAAVRRPALVVSDSSQMLDTIIAAVTSRIRDPLPPTHYVIDSSHPDWKPSGLRLPSAIRCDRLFTIDDDAVQKTLGHLSDATMLGISHLLRIALAIP